MVQETECKSNGACQRPSNDEDEAYVLNGGEANAIEGLRSIGEEIFDKMVGHGDKVAMVDGDNGKEETFNTLRTRAAAIALALKARGITSKDIVTLVELTTSDAFEVLLGIVFSGATVSMLDGAWTVPNTAYTLLPLYRPRVVFTHLGCLDKVKKVLKMYPETLQQTELVVYGYDDPEECGDCLTLDGFASEFDENDANNFKPSPIEDLANTSVMILCTSGSTGVPKGVVHSHKNLAETIVGGGRLFPQGLTMFTNAPCYWVSGIYMFFIALFSGNKKIYTKKPFSELNVLGLIQKYQVNAAFLSSYQISMINQHEKTQSYDLSSLRILLCGGSRLSDGQTAQLQKRIPKGIVLFGYGMTEMASGTGMTPTVKPKPGSVGKPGAGLSIKILDLETGKPLGPNKSGEIYLRGPCMMGYYGNQAATDEILDRTTGWLRSGDIGHYDEEGYLFVTDRLKEIAKYKGLYINPTDLENVLASHPDVKCSCVITVSHDETCDLVVAFVELKQGQETRVTTEELEEYVNGRVEDFQKLRGGLHLLDKIPVLTHGKVARPAVKQIAAGMKDKIVQHFKTHYAK